jgi:hypothetical protein
LTSVSSRGKQMSATTSERYLYNTSSNRNTTRNAMLAQPLMIPTISSFKAIRPSCLRMTHLLAKLTYSWVFTVRCNMTFLIAVVAGYGAWKNAFLDCMPSPRAFWTLDCRGFQDCFLIFFSIKYDTRTLLQTKRTYWVFTVRCNVTFLIAVVAGYRAWKNAILHCMSSPRAFWTPDCRRFQDCFLIFFSVKYDTR